MAPRFNRRTVFKLLAASSAGAMLPWLRTRQAAANPEDVPLRMLVVEVGDGARRGTWEIDVPGPFDPTSLTVETTWSLRPVMSALAPHRGRMTLFQNLDMVSVRNDGSSAANAHIDGATHMATAASRFNGTGDLGGGVSFDQAIAAALNADTPLTRLRSLEVGAKEHGASISNEHYYALPGQKLPFINHVHDIWDHVFPEPLGQDQAEQQRLIARRTSVYNHVRADYQRLIARLGREDRDKIQAMLDLRAELQETLTLINDREANRPPESITDPFDDLDDKYQAGSDTNRRWNTKVDIISQIVAGALHTDTTRVCSYRIGNAPNYEFDYVAGTAYGGVVTSDWHDLNHKVSGDNPELEDPVAQGHIFDMHRLGYEKVAALLDLLAGLPETDGGTMLDHTMVVVISHIGEGSHEVTRLPWMVFGDAHGALRTGQYIRFPITHKDDINDVGALDYPQDAGQRQYNYRGRPHGDFFTTLATAMAVPQTIGEAQPETRGVIDEMLV
ncbi:MAG: DUF1552 domain-containing protein [Myxococcota bacterium]